MISFDRCKNESVTDSATKAASLSFGRYELIEKVATGGMAEVYRARAHRAGGVSKTVCLKRIHPSLCADPSFVDMFIEEARLGLTLSHGNIVPVFDFGCVDGYHFLVMDFVEGYDLAEVIARSKIVSEPFPVELAVYVVLEVLEGLAYAHELEDENGRPLDLVHRDISPSNVMVSRSGEVKILDFGIARSALREFRTRTGIVKGKPGYMAPEQARGDSVDARVDVFACGVMLHELLTGERPPGRESEPDSISSAGTPTREIDDEQLEDIVERALAVEREVRFESAAEMGSALNEVLLNLGEMPRASRLAEYVDSLFSASAQSPDWSHQHDAVDRHLAALVAGDQEEVDEDVEADDELDEDVERTEEIETQDEATEQLEQEVAAPSRSRWKYGGVLLLALLAITLVGVVGLDLVGDRSGESSEAPRQRIERPIAEEAELRVKTTPAGARIRIGDRTAPEVTPTSVSLAPGEHEIQLHLDGYEPLERRVELLAGQSVMLELPLTALPGELRVTSEPPGATVRINGRKRGVTPVEVGELSRTGTYLVEVTGEGFSEFVQEVRLDEERRRTVHAALTPEERSKRSATRTGFLSVVARPWAEVILDGRSLGETPLIRRVVPAGRHVIVLRNPPRNAEVWRAVVVTAGEEKRISVDLTSPR